MLEAVALRALFIALEYRGLDSANRGEWFAGYNPDAPGVPWFPDGAKIGGEKVHPLQADLFVSTRGLSLQEPGGRNKSKGAQCIRKPAKLSMTSGLDQEYRAGRLICLPGFLLNFRLHWYSASWLCCIGGFTCQQTGRGSRSVLGSFVVCSSCSKYVFGAFQ